MLYGLDRAFESVGIGNGGAGERLGEAQALVAGGDAPAGLIHAAKVVAKTPAGQTAAPAIEEAATRLENGPVGPGSNGAVQNLLTYITETHSQENGEQVVGSAFGSGVASRAHLIGRPEGPSTEAAGQGDAKGDEDAPGNSGSAPGQNKDEGDEDAPGNPEIAPGQTEDEGDEDAPGNSEIAPGQSGENPGQAPSGGGPPGQRGENPGQAPSGGGPPGQGG